MQIQIKIHTVAMNIFLTSRHCIPLQKNSPNLHGRPTLNYPTPLQQHNSTTNLAIADKESVSARDNKEIVVNTEMVKSRSNCQETITL